MVLKTTKFLAVVLFSIFVLLILAIDMSIGLKIGIIGFGVLLALILERFNIQAITGMFVGGLFGILIINIVFLLIKIAMNDFPPVSAFFFKIKGAHYIALNIAFAYAGILIGYNKANELLKRKGGAVSVQSYNKVIDTSSIIDGRIYSVIKSGFLEGTLIIPAFVLAELQHIADSKDHERRTRGRRGLDILNQIKKQKNIDIEISEINLDEIKEVDKRLIKLCKILDASLITTDFNLNKVAEFEGIKVLNINELSNGLKPMVLPEDQLKIKVIRIGKEPHQGVGYLEDGTMVVIQDGDKLLNKTVDTTVTSVLQSNAGRIIFTKIKKR